MPAVHSGVWKHDNLTKQREFRGFHRDYMYVLPGSTTPLATAKLNWVAQLSSKGQQQFAEELVRG